MTNSESTKNLREPWLSAATDELRKLFKEKGYDLPPVRVTCGWPSSGGRPGGKHTRLGECWSGTCSEDGTPQIFVTPIRSEAVEVLEILTHELSHATVGNDCQHKGEFVKCIRALGLEGKPTATHAGDELKVKLEQVASTLGTYPHAKLVPSDKEKKKQTTRMIKATCQECNCTFRLARKWIEEASGVLECPMPTCEGEVDIDDQMLPGEP